jgi:hypothetical protein
LKADNREVIEARIGAMHTLRRSATQPGRGVLAPRVLIAFKMAIACIVV